MVHMAELRSVDTLSVHERLSVRKVGPAIVAAAGVLSVAVVDFLLPHDMAASASVAAAIGRIARRDVRFMILWLDLGMRGVRNR